MAKFGPYELVERIGRGGMGEIYFALLRREGAFRKNLVIKRILPNLGQDQEFIKMFTREARVAALLNHQNIVDIYDYGREGDEYFIAMEYVDGGDLRTLLHYQEPPPLPAAVTILLGVARALDYAHRKRDEKNRPIGIVHRDVSPGNVLLSRDGEVKLTDFGLVAAGPAKRSAEETGVVKGKYAYMSPEQTYGDPVDARSDLFSFGVLSYESLTGAKPFEGDLISVFDRIRKAEYPPIDGDRVPPRLVQLIDSCLSVHPEERPDTAADVVRILETVAQDFTMPEGVRALSEWTRAGCGPQRLQGAGSGGSDQTAVGDQPIRLPTPLHTDSVPYEDTASLTGEDVAIQPAKHRRVALWGLAALLFSAIGVLTWTTLDDRWKSSLTPLPTPFADVEQQTTEEYVDVYINSEPEGATLEVGGVEVGQTPIRLSEVSRDDSLLLRFSLEPYQTIERDIAPSNLPFDEVLRLHVLSVQLDLLPAQLNVTSDPPCQASLDNTPIGETPLSHWVEGIGSHVLSLSCEGFQTETREIELGPGQQEDIHVTLLELFSFLLSAEPQTAEIELIFDDGRQLSCESTPCSISATQGTGELVAVADGYHELTQPFDLNDDLQLVLTLDQINEHLSLSFRSSDLELTHASNLTVTNTSASRTIEFSSQDEAFAGRVFLDIRRIEQSNDAEATIGVRCLPWAMVALDDGDEESTPFEVAQQRLDVDTHRLTIRPAGEDPALTIEMRLRLVEE